MSTPPISPVPPPRPVNPALWWVLGVLVFFAALALVGITVFGAVLLRHLRVNENAKQVEIQTPVGSLKVNKDEMHPTGLPVYPGAVRASNEGANVELSAGDEHVGIAAEKYTTQDPLEKVETWYRQRLGTDYRIEKAWNIVVGSKRDIDLGEADIAFVNDRGDQGRVVAIKTIQHGTEIALLRAGKKEIQ